MTQTYVLHAFGVALALAAWPLKLLVEAAAVALADPATLSAKDAATLGILVMVVSVLGITIAAFYVQE